MNALIVIVVVLAVAVVAIVVLRGNRGRRPARDDVASFRRQIDALSPEARRQTTERMKPRERSSAGDDGADAQ